MLYYALGWRPAEPDAAPGDRPDADEVAPGGGAAGGGASGTTQTAVQYVNTSQIMYNFLIQNVTLHTVQLQLK